MKENHVFGHNDPLVTFDPELVMGHLLDQTLVLLTKFGQNRVKHVTTRVNLDVDRRKKKKLDIECVHRTLIQQAPDSIFDL